MKALRPPYDLVLTGGRLVDGSGRRPFKADLAVKKTRIAAIGDLGDARAEKRIDVEGKCVAPGFIDVHAHDDVVCVSRASMMAKVSQGVTTVVVGNCGISLPPLCGLSTIPDPLNLLGEPADFKYSNFHAYFDAVDAAGPATNLVSLVGHSSLRLATMSALDRIAKPRELARMLELLDEAMRAGAAGLSSGVFYAPGRAADNREIVPLLTKVGEYGGIYASHLRDEYDGILDSMNEAIAAASAAEVGLVISHHKCAGLNNWGRSTETLSLLEQANGTTPVNVDCYPYEAGSSVLDPALVEEEMKVLISWSRQYPDAAGRVLAEVAREWGCSQRDAALRLKPGGACYFQMSEEDVHRIMRHPLAMVGSDGLPHHAHPHPRLWGTFPRVIRRYVLEQGLLSLEEAVRKMTGLPAEKFHLRDRGVLAVGAYADITVFDPGVIEDTATYEHPKRVSRGIDHVLVNGQPTWNGVELSPLGHGKVLRGNGVVRRARRSVW